MRLLTAVSLVRVQQGEFWLHGQAVKTPPSHGGITSSSLVRVTIFLLVGVYGKEVPPVPIPNTEVKLFYAYDT